MGKFLESPIISCSPEIIIVVEWCFRCTLLFQCASSQWTVWYHGEDLGVSGFIEYYILTG